MTLDISFSKAPYKNTEAAVICFYNDKEPSPSVGSLNYEFKGFVDHVLEKSKSFKGKSGQVEILMLPEGAPYSYVVLLGCGKREDFTKIEAEKLGGKLLCALEAKKIETVEFYADNELSGCGALTAHVAVGLALRSYKFELYQSPDEEDEKTVLSRAHFVLFE
ncbi:MAG: hypothetical protein COB36_08325, partial [Alphaproteobacteria bacterium]